MSNQQIIVQEIARIRHALRTQNTDYSYKLLESLMDILEKSQEASSEQPNYEEASYRIAECGTYIEEGKWSQAQQCLERIEQALRTKR